MVEQGTENLRVGGSIPSLAILLERPLYRSALVAGVLSIAAACGDKCETLCREASLQLDACKPESLSWPDLGARGRQDFVNVCRSQWERERRELSSSELAVALEFCDDTADLTLSCAEWTALYAPTP